MCTHKLYIFLGCGHSVPSSNPILLCKAARAEQDLAARVNSPSLGPNPINESEENEQPLAEAGEPSQSHPDSDSKSNHPDSTSPPSEECNSPPRNRLTKRHAIPFPSSCATQKVHPFHTYRIHSMCAICRRRRTERLNSIQASPEIKVDDYKWKVRIITPPPVRTASITESMSPWSSGNGIGLGMGMGMGNIGEVMGSWVKDWKGLASDPIATFGDMRPMKTVAERDRLEKKGLPSR